VFNNAGAALPATETGDVAWADWRRVVGVNLDGAFLIARGAFRKAWSILSNLRGSRWVTHP